MDGSLEFLIPPAQYLVYLGGWTGKDGVSTFVFDPPICVDQRVVVL